MAREKFQTLTEQMFYVLMGFKEESCGVDVMEKVLRMTDEKLSIGPGTMYTLTNSFEKASLIRETKVEGRKRTYIITEKGQEMLENEYQRIKNMQNDYERYFA